MGNPQIDITGKYIFTFTLHSAYFRNYLYSEKNSAGTSKQDYYNAADVF